ncbi:hypothetical protein YC2023_117449 [Brassica napus]
MDQYMEPAHYGDQDVLNNSTEVNPSDRTRQTDRAVYRINPRTSGKELWVEPRPDDRTYRNRARLSRPSRHSKENSRARLKLGREEPKDGHAFSPGRPSGQSRPTHSFFLRWLALDHRYIKSHFASLDDPFNTSQFQKCHLPSRIISNTQLKDEKQFASNGFDFVKKQRNQRKRQNRFDEDEKRVRNGDRPFTKAKRSNCDMLDRNELQTFAILEKMLHKAIFKPLVTLESDNVETEPDKEGFSDLLPTFDDYAHEPIAGISELIFALEKDSKKVLNKNEFSGPLNNFEMGAYDLGLGSFVSIQDGTDKEQNCGHQANQEGPSSIQSPNQTQGEQCSDYDSFAYNPFPFNVTDLRTNLFEDGENDVPQTMDQYMEQNLLKRKGMMCLSRS